MNPSQILKTVAWKDLRHLSTLDVLIENNLTLPPLFISWVLAYHGYYVFALPFSAFFFLAALRQVHNGFHHSLGTSRALTEASLYLNSALMMVSVHAVKYNHLRHHKHCLTDKDHEGKPARMSWWGAILYGPVHLWTIHRITWQEAGRPYRRAMIAELAAIGLFTAAVLLSGFQVLLYHIAVMLAGELLSAFFAVWTVHHHTDEHPLVARTQRKGWKNWVTLNMFYHREHHLFPAVPTIKLPELARRLDKALPQLPRKSTF